jgi:adenosylhomocysteine nucleosidase
LTLLGIVVALKAEAQILFNGKDRGKDTHHHSEKIIKVSGVGPVRAKRAAEALIEKGATALLSWGTAGGLKGDLSPGDLILPFKVLLTSNVIYPVDVRWHDRLKNRLRKHMNIHTGSIIQSPTTISAASEKHSLYRKHGAIAVDMESTAVAQVAKASSVPFIAIRAITDSVHMTIPKCVLNATDEFGNIYSFRFLKRLFRHPDEIYPMIRLVLGFRAAQKTLKNVLRYTNYRLLI